MSITILIPLLDNRVAGLINVISAAQYGVPYLVSGIPAIRQYYSEKSNNLLTTNNIEEWKKVVLRWASYSYEE